MSVRRARELADAFRMREHREARGRQACCQVAQLFSAARVKFQDVCGIV